jgi:hypothetical protein
MTKSESVFAEIGREVLGPALHSFALWLHSEAKRDGVERLFFLARDGYMMQKAYQAAIPESEQIPNQYMFASRRLFNFAAITQLDERALRLLMGDRVEMPVEQYLLRIGLDALDYEAELKAAGFVGPNEVVKGNWDRLERLLRLLEGPIVQAAADERSLVLRYADSLTDWDGTVCGVVDIGWHGSLQASLRDVLGLPVGHLRGYYFGLHASVDKHSERMKAFFDERKLSDLYTSWRTFRRCREIFEIFFIGREGSIIGLEETAPGQFKAVQAAILKSGSILRGIETMQAEAIRSIQTAPAAPRRSVVRARLRRLLSRPTRVQAAALGDIVHQEGFGGYGRLAHIARPSRRLSGYLLRPAELVYEYRKTFWRPGFIARLKF